MPIHDKLRNLDIYFKDRSRSNETGIEHVSKSYHDLDPSDIELLEETINNPLEHTKDKRYARTYCYYHKRKRDRKNYIKVVIKIEKRDPKVGFISSIFITSRIK